MSKHSILKKLLVLIITWLFGFVADAGAQGRTLFSYQSGNFGAPNIWTLTNGGLDFVVPNADDNFVINAGNTITLTTNSQIIQTVASRTVIINGELNVQTFTTQTIGLISGTGTLRISTGAFPTVLTALGANPFLQTGGGTVQYESATYSLPATNIYNNLVITGTGVKSFAPGVATTFTLNGNLDVSAGTLTVGGTGAAAVVTLNTAGNLTVATGATLNVGASTNTVVHQISLSGNLTNNGTIDLTNLADGANPFATAGGSAYLRFIGASNNAVTLNIGHSTQFGNFIVNKGTGQTFVLSMTVQTGAANPEFFGNGGTTTPSGQRFVIANGTLRLGANITIPNLIPFGLNYNLGCLEDGSNAVIPAIEGENGALWNDGATISATGNALVVYGTFRSTAGTITCTSQGLAPRGTGSVIVEGGVVNARKYRPSSFGVTIPRGSFSLSGGVVNVNASFPGAADANFARFSMQYTDQVFTMTGGILNIADPETSAPATNGLIDIRCAPSNINVTGGTINVTIPASGTNAHISSTAPFPNFTVTKAGAGTATLLLATVNSAVDGDPGVGLNIARPLTILNNFTLQTGNAPLFNANGQDVIFGGSVDIQTATTFQTGTNTTSFVDTGIETLAITGTVQVSVGNPGFNNLTINRSTGSLTALNSFTVRGAFTLAGVAPFSDGGNTVSLLGNLLNSGTHQSTGTGSITLAGTATQTIGGNGNGTFGNLTLTNGATPGATLTANQAIDSVLTLSGAGIRLFNIGTFRLRINNGAIGAIDITGGAFSATRNIRTAGNASDLGLQRAITGTGNYLYPVGTIAGYTPAEININSFTSTGFISVNPVGSILATTAGPNPDILSYYWKVRQVGFTTLPTVSHRFTYLDASIGGTEANYVPGRVLDETPFTRSTDGGIDDVIDATNQIVWNGATTGGIYPGAGFTLANANYTAGGPSRFAGAPTIYFNRLPTGSWNTTSSWTTAPIAGNRTGSPAAAAVPGAADIVIIDRGPDGANSITVPAATTIAAAEVRFASNESFGGGPGSGNLALLNFTSSNATANFSVVTGIAPAQGQIFLTVQSAAPVAPTLNGDFGGFVADVTNEFIYQNSTDATAILPAVATLPIYPILRIEGVGNNSQVQFPNAVTVNGDLRVGAFASRCTLRVNSNFTVLQNINIGFPGAGSSNGAIAFVGGTARTIQVNGNLQLRSLTGGGSDFRIYVEPGAGTVTHSLVVNGNVSQGLGVIDLFNGNAAGDDNATLTFGGTTNTSFDVTTGPAAELFRLIVNKGTDTTNSATLNAPLTIGGATGGATKAIELQNGRLILNNATLNLNLTSGGANFTIPETAGLIVQQGTATVTGTATGVLLDGLLRVQTNGILNFGNGSTTDVRYIEYSSGGNARLQVLTGGTLLVNTQIRRSAFSTAGVLRYFQNGGATTIFGEGATAARAKFEIENNPGSEFIMSGGTLAIVRGGGTTFGDLYLRPATSSVTGGTIILNPNPGAPATAAGAQTYDIDANIALNALTITGSAGNVATGRVRVNPLTLTNILSLQGDLTISNTNSILNANGLNVFIGGDLVNNNPSSATGLTVGGYQPITATQTTTFNRSGVATITGVTGNLTNFANLVINNSGGTLTLNPNSTIRVNTDLTINSASTLADNGNTITVIRNINNDGTHVSVGSGSITLAGSIQQVLAGEGVYGNLTLNNASGTRMEQNNTINNVLTLTNGIFDIGANLLALNNTGAAVAGTFSNTRMIRTNGSNVDQGVSKAYPTGGFNFLFPIGSSTLYTPARLNVTATTTPGTIRVAPVNNVHPAVDAGANVLRYYWIVRSTGFTGVSVNHIYNDGGDNTILVTGTPDRVGRVNPDLIPSNWDPVGGYDPLSLPPPLTAATYANAARSITLTTANFINGDYTAGSSAEFASIPLYTSIATGFWEDAANWTTSPVTFTPPRQGSNVVIDNTHTIETRPNAIVQVAINVAGGGYAVGNVLTITGGGGTGGQVTVTAVGGLGNITGIRLTNGGTGYATTTGATTSGGSGTGATVNITASFGKIGNSVAINPTGVLNLGNTIGHNFSSISGQGTLRINATGSGSFVFPGGTITSFVAPGGGTVEYSGAVSGTLPGAPTTYNNLRFTNTAGTASLANVDLTLNGSLSVAGAGGAVSNPSNRDITVAGGFNISNGTYNAGNGTLAVSGNLTGSGTGYTFNAQGTTMNLVGRLTNTGTFNANASTISISGADGGSPNFSFANTGTFNAGTGTVNLIGGSVQTIGGSNTVFNNLGVNKSANNITLAGASDQTVNGTFTLTNGLVFTGSNALVLGPSSSVLGGSNASYVDGNISGVYTTTLSSRRYPFGASGLFRPISIPASAASSTATLRGFLNPTSALTVTTTLSGLSNVSTLRHYQFQNSGQPLTVTSVENLQVNSDDVVGSFTSNNTLRVGTAVSIALPTWTGRTLTTAPNTTSLPVSITTNTFSQSVAVTGVGSIFYATLASVTVSDNPLPVELASFTLRPVDNGVSLKWETASETDNAGFIIERATVRDGNYTEIASYRTVESLKGLGTSPTGKVYEFTDKSRLIPGATYFYKLKDVDLQGRITEHEVKEIKMPNEYALSQNYPNPFNPTTTIEFSLNKSGMTRLEVYNVLGQKVATVVDADLAAGSYRYQVNAVNLASGVYFYRLQSRDFVATRKMMLVK